MRKYSKNSPQAAARFVALTIVADGDVAKAELASLDELAVHKQTGMEHDALHAVIDTFCEDLLSSKQLAWADNCPVDEYTLSELMGEIDDPALRRKVLGFCVALAEVDGHVAAPPHSWRCAFDQMSRRSSIGGPGLSLLARHLP